MAFLNLFLMRYEDVVVSIIRVISIMFNGNSGSKLSLNG